MAIYIVINAGNNLLIKAIYRVLDVYFYWNNVERNYVKLPVDVTSQTPRVFNQRSCRQRR